MTNEEYAKIYQEQRDQYAANILNQGWQGSQQQAANGLANAQATESLVAPYTFWISDSGDETKPIEEIYAAPEVKIDSEAERTERLWLAIKEFSGG